MNEVHKIIGTIVTAIISLLMLCLTIYGIIIANFAVILTCALLSMLFGVVSYSDYIYFYGDKNNKLSE